MFQIKTLLTESWNIRLNIDNLSVGGCQGQTMLFFQKKINFKFPILLNLLLPFFELEVNFSWPSWISKYVISSLNTLYETRILYQNFKIFGTSVSFLKAMINSGYNEEFLTVLHSQFLTHWSQGPQKWPKAQLFIFFHFYLRKHWVIFWNNFLWVNFCCIRWKIELSILPNKGSTYKIFKKRSTLLVYSILPNY